MTFTTLYLLLPLYAFSSLLQNSDLTHLQCKLLDADRSCWTHWVRLQTPWLPCVLNIYMKIIVFYDDYWNFYIKIRFNYIVQYLPITKIGHQLDQCCWLRSSVVPMIFPPVDQIKNWQHKFKLWQQQSYMVVCCVFHHAKE